MRNREIDDLAALRRALGQPTPPKEIWQKPFDYDPAHLHALARLEPDERARAGDLCKYAYDLYYEEVQKDLLLHTLPFCLRAWREELRGKHFRGERFGYGAFLEKFHPALVNGRILDGVLTLQEANAVSSFMRAAILEEIDKQRGLSFAGMRARPYRWICALTTHSVLLPDIDRLWTAWWSFKTVGRAIAAVQYLSCLIYGEQDNPVFASWTQDRGGGPPRLWEFAGFLYNHSYRWLAPNVAFLKGTLNAARVTEVLRNAVDRLVGQPEHDAAARVLADAGARTALLESRCQELAQILGEKHDPNVLREWSR